MLCPSSTHTHSKEWCSFSYHYFYRNRTQFHVPVKKCINACCLFALIASYVAICVLLNINGPSEEKHLSYWHDNLSNRSDRGMMSVHRLRTHQGYHFNTMYLQDSSELPALFTKWRSSLVILCEGHFKAFGNITAILHNVRVNTSLCFGPKGGEPLFSVMNQEEEVEFLRCSSRFFTLPCVEMPYYNFHYKSYVADWMSVLDKVGTQGNIDEFVSDFTIAITRTAYTNLYTAMVDFYNTFLIMTFFNKTQQETNILVLDAHPAGGLDSVWQVLFNSMTRASDLHPVTYFANLVFGISSSLSPLVNYRGTEVNTFPLSDEFRQFFLSSYNIPLERPLNCDKLVILVVFRRNYIAHPRNPRGIIQRKIRNEVELLSKIELRFPNSSVHGAQLDIYPMKTQLKIVTQADILIGMHGAALSLLMFLNKGRTVIELLPIYISPRHSGRYMKLAHDMGITYKRWANLIKLNEHPNYFTTVPVGDIINLIIEASDEMCPKKESIHTSGYT